MFEMREESGSAPAPIRVCDFCGKPIAEADPGGPVIPPVLRLGQTYRVRDAHEGRCRDFLEERLARESREPPKPQGDSGA
jgi:hypothetical protein